MREQGEVIKIEGTRALVSVESSTACERCEARHFCHPEGSKRVIEANNPIHARVGDRVIFEIARGSSIFASFSLFGIPVILGLVGILWGSRYGELYGVVLGCAGLIAGMIIAKVINNIVCYKSEVMPVITENLQVRDSSTPISKA
jgi:sigma-E factor negative regulatory protein RseC